MPLPKHIRAVTFDCFGTLIDWNTGIGGSLAAWADRHGLAIDADTLTRQLGEAQRRHQVARPFKSYRVVLRDAFLDLAAGHGVLSAEADAEAFARSVATWPAFSDTLAGLRHLKRLARLGIMSNVDDASIAEVHRIHLGGLLDEIVTADEVGAYKPCHAHFTAMKQRLAHHGIATDTWLHVAQSRFHDIAPCRELHIACVWLDRVGDRAEKGMTIFGTDALPDLTVYGMAEVMSAVERGA